MSVLRKVICPLCVKRTVFSLQLVRNRKSVRIKRVFFIIIILYFPMRPEEYKYRVIVRKIKPENKIPDLETLKSVLDLFSDNSKRVMTE